MCGRPHTGESTAPRNRRRLHDQTARVSTLQYDCGRTSVSTPHIAFCRSTTQRAAQSGFAPSARRRRGTAHSTWGGAPSPSGQAERGVTEPSSRALGIRVVHAPSAAHTPLSCTKHSAANSRVQPPRNPARPRAAGAQPVTGTDMTPRLRLRGLPHPAAKTHRSGRRAHAPPGSPAHPPSGAGSDPHRTGRYTQIRPLWNPKKVPNWGQNPPAHHP